MNDRTGILIKMGLAALGLFLVVVGVRFLFQDRPWQGLGLLWAGLAVWSIPLGWG